MNDISGQHIFNLRDRICSEVIASEADAVIMFWDSDLTSRNIDHESEHAIKKQIEILSHVNQTMKAEMKYFAIADPSLQGELPDEMNGNDQCLDRMCTNK